MDKLVLGVHHISLKPYDDASFEKAVHFYGALLGLPEVRRWGQGPGRTIMLAAGNCIIEINLNGQRILPTGSINHFALSVSDVDRAVEICRQAGCAVTLEACDRAPTLPDGSSYPLRLAFVVGPLGEEIEFFQEK